MQARRIILTFLIALTLMMVWNRLADHLWPPAPPEAAQTQPAPRTNRSATQTGPSGGQVVQGAGSGMLLEVRQTDERNDQIVLGDGREQNGYKMRAILSNRSGSLCRVELAEHAEKVNEPNARYPLLAEVDYPGGVKRCSLTTQRLDVIMPNNEKFQADLAQTRWFVDHADSEKAEFHTDIYHQDLPLLRVYKTYVLHKNSYDLDLALRVESLVDEPLTIVVRQEGPLGMHREDPRSDDRKTCAGLRSLTGQANVSVEKVDRAKLLKESGHEQDLNLPDRKLIWAGQVNKYFTALLAPSDASVQNIRAVEVLTYTTDPELGEDLTTLWITHPIVVEKANPAVLGFELYLGPKSGAIFDKVDRYRNRNYSGTFEYSLCTFQWLAEIMVWLLDQFYRVTRNYGLAVILLVVVVRLIMHPITKSSQANMFRMQRDMKRLQPKMQALKEKHKNNREALNKAMMELYKEEGINPAGQVLGCLPMALQMPIWVALWTALNNTVELRHAPFFLWIKDLSGPDALITFAQSIHVPFLGAVHQLNILPILLGISMMVQQKFSPQAAPADPAQAKQQKFMFYFMSVFMLLIFYNGPSGLNLYILTSNLIGFLENNRIKKHLEKEEQKAPIDRKGRKAKGSWWEMLAKKFEKMAEGYEKNKKAKAKVRK
jgi:YidC/Oxa1 family membrane protein insertase